MIFFLIADIFVGLNSNYEGVISVRTIGIDKNFIGVYLGKLKTMTKLKYHYRIV